MQLLFDKFYRNFGVRTYMGLANPIVYPIRDLPKNSVMHYLTEDDQEFPDASSILLKSATRRILLKNITELAEGNHSVSRVVTPVQNKIFGFIQEKKQFMLFLKPLSEAKEENQLVYCNYNLVKNLYRYPETQKMTPYWKWYDRQMTMWDEIEKLTESSQRQHFYEFKVPMDLPSRARLNQHRGMPTPETAFRFDTAEKKFLLDFWKWLDPETRSGSALSKISVNNLSKVNIMFLIKDGRSTVLNLGYMNSWIKGQINQTDRPRVNGMNPGDLQTIFLKFLMSLQSYNVEVDKSARESETLAEDDRQPLETDVDGDFIEPTSGRQGEMDGQEDNPETSLGSKSDREDPLDGASGFTSGKKLFEVEKAKGFNDGTGSSNGASPSNSVKNAKGKKAKDAIVDEDSASEPKSLEETLKELEAETATLEVLENRREQFKAQPDEEVKEYDPTESEEEGKVIAKVLTPKEPHEHLLERLDKMASKGTVTAADYRKIQKTLEAQPNKPDPYGTDKTLKEASTVLKEDLHIEEKHAVLAGDDRILDHSMKRSVVESLDRDYIRKVMSKDVLGSIMAVQSTGVVVTDIQTEIQHSALGAFEVHQISLKPLDGRSSTIRVKLPKVEEDGTFKANGVRYHMRKQRTDVPIRKISPENVALSSYYGKLFVFRSPKKADSALATVVKHLTAASIGEVPDVSKVAPANVFDNLFEAPYIYNALANYYKGFDVASPIFGNLHFNFEHRTRQDLTTPELLTLIEKDGSRIVGVNKKGAPIFVTKENEFFVRLQEGDQPLGDIFDILSLDRTKAPVDPAMLKVMGRTLPVGLVMARAIGFRNLLKLLKPKYRMVKGRQQKNLEPYEYAISFEDYSLIFDRRDKVASLILGGFDVCGKSLKLYPAAAYDTKEVYDNLLEGLGATVMVSRELDLLESSYVDPITKGLLQKMNEPETFLGLLVRSAELLTTYDHPLSQDLDFQEIRGYERFAGAIYRETIRSIRTFKNRNISGRSKVEMSPYAVWQNLMEDASVKTCEDINPVQNLKMHESVTFVGEGGRSKDAFMKDARAFNKTDAGVISEASVDSGDVGINIFLSGNPKIDSLRGTKSKEPAGSDPGNYLSSSMLLAVGVQHDD